MAYTPAPARSYSTSRQYIVHTAHYDDAVDLPGGRWPWLCLHCHTVQPAERIDCRNCGAPKPTPEAQP